ncbi:MAG: FlaD/FlaE family flagellar protein [Thermoplasmatota archaeon]
MNKQKILTKELLEKELNVLVEKNVISQRIAEKIKQKVQKENLSINQNDLVKLIDHVQLLLNTRTSKEHNHQFFSNNTIQHQDIPDSPDFSLTLKQKSIPHDTLPRETNAIEKNFDTINKEQKKYDEIPEDPTKKQKNVISQNKHHSIVPLSDLINDPEHIIVLFKWLQYLIDKIGNEQLPTILNYYVDIHWISENVCMNLLKYAKGITFEGDERTKQHYPSTFTTTDHLQSFLFIQRLKGTALTEDFLWKIDNELEQMQRALHYHQQPHSRK